MHVVARVGAVFVHVSFIEIYRDPVEMSVPNFGLGHQRVRELRDVGR